MARRPTKKKEEQNEIVKALEFVGLAQAETGNNYETHCRIDQGQVVAFNGIIAIGCAFAFDISACPHTKRLTAAIAGSQTPSITQIDPWRLSVTTSKLRAIIPCVDPRDLLQVGPDARVGWLTNDFREALIGVSDILVESGDRVVLSSAYCRSQSVITTNGHVIFESWHGIDMPDGLIVPKAFVTTLKKINKDITGFGFSNGSLTIYFDDESWIRTQLYNGNDWPNFQPILDRIVPTKAVDTPADFFDAVRAVAPYCDDNGLRVINGAIHSHDTTAKGAQYTVPGLVADFRANPKCLLAAQPFAAKVDFLSDATMMLFFGDKVRGAIVKQTRV